MRNKDIKDMTITRTIKISFQGASHNVDLSAPFTLAGLQHAVASKFAVDLPPRAGLDEAAEGSDLSFTYKDSEGDDIVFDKDSELSLALRLCPSSLEISAARKKAPSSKPNPERRLYQVAARNLREYNGVPSMTPAKLPKTLSFLKLGPRRLVKQGLAPRVLLARMNAEGNKNEGLTQQRQEQQQPLGDGENEEGLAEAVTAGMEMVSVKDDKQEPGDGFVSVESPPVAVATASETADDKQVIHKAFIAAGIRLRPREVQPLLLALGVVPRRLVKLGYVDKKHLPRLLAAEKKMANASGGANADGNRIPNAAANLQQKRQQLCQQRLRQRQLQIRQRLRQQRQQQRRMARGGGGRCGLAGPVIQRGCVRRGAGAPVAIGANVCPPGKGTMSAIAHNGRDFTVERRQPTMAVCRGICPAPSVLPPPPTQLEERVARVRQARRQARQAHRSGGGGARHQHLGF